MMAYFLRRNQSALIALTLFLVCMGAYQLANLPISLYPNTSKPVVRVQLFFKDDVSQFMRYWGEKVETSLKNIKDVELVEGEYRQGKATYLVHFEWHKDNDEAIRDVASVSAFYQAQLPRDLPPIKVGFFNPGSECYIVVNSDTLSTEQLSKELKNSLLPALNEIDGVSQSWVSALGEKHVSVRLDPIKAAEYNLVIDDIINTIKTHEFDYSLGSISTERDGKIAVNVQKRNSSIAKLESITVARIEGRAILLKDVAQVVIAETELARVLQLDGKNAVAVAVWPKPDANLYQVSQDFLAEARAYTSSVGTIHVLNDPSEFIDEAIHTVIKAILLGMTIAAFSVLIFFRSFGKTIVVCLAMPLSLLGAGVLMSVMGVDINLLSLGAISVSIGMVVDGAIVVIDNIDRHQQRSGSEDNLVFRAVSEVAPAIFASVLTTIIVFVPMAFTIPIASSLLSDIAFVVVSIMLFSILITLVFIPALFSLCTVKSKLGEGQISNKRVNPIEYVIQRVCDVYCFLLKTLLINRFIQLLFVAVISVVAWAASNVLGDIRQELIAKPEAEIIDVIVSFKKDGLEMADRIALLEPIRQQIDAAYHQKIKFAYSDIRKNAGYISLHLTDYRVFEDVFMGLQRLLQNNEDVDIEVEPWITSALAVPDFPDLRLLVTGETEHERRQQLDQLYEAFRGQAEVKKVKVTPKNQQSTKYEITYNQQMLTQLFAEQDIDDIKQQLADYVGMAIEEKYLSEIELFGEQSTLFAQLGDETLSKIEEIGDLPFFIDEQIFHLRDILEIQNIKQWKLFYSRNSAPIYMAEVWLKEGEQHQASLVLDRVYAGQSGQKAIPFILDKPKEQVTEGIISLIKSLLLAFGLVLLAVLFLFASLKLSLIICAAIPFAILGAIISLYLFDSTLSLNSMLGMIMLCGISVNNSIIFVDVYRRVLAESGDIVTGIIGAARLRFRAIMVTNLTTIAGLVPLAIGFGSGGKILQPLGVSVACGIALSTIFTMFCIPLLLVLFDRNKAEQSDALVATS
ncbi:efflux RND transporter permease subunit [Pseudoalteromonas sp. T1lg23B]|uniref:efflux RND transporter permease subunit n=1 Tax=Pseudoalteromonas sp. T1lg23B TaxID=2077097 RepID=UPI000CF73300|nr:efflux RND transporter permease subunit [Pseudoalteromonas sp. T1lg23B]